MPNSSSHEEVLTACQDPAVKTIYVGIGCAGSKPQQYPPFLNSMPGKQVCYLIDPVLDMQSWSNLYLETLDIKDPDSVLFIPERKHFSWRYAGGYLVNALCALVLRSTDKRLIVQNYTGEDIAVHYPLHGFGLGLLKRVLFDVTYGDADQRCFVNFDKVSLLINPDDGTFFQPMYETITALRSYSGLPASYVTNIVLRRIKKMGLMIGRFYNVFTGIDKSQAVWVTSEYLAKTITVEWMIYGPSASVVTHDASVVTHDALESFMINFLVDLVPTTVEEDARKVIRAGEYPNLIREIMEAENITT
jgi:hypothetical protein